MLVVVVEVDPVVVVVPPVVVVVVGLATHVSLISVLLTLEVVSELPLHDCVAVSPPVSGGREVEADSASPTPTPTKARRTTIPTKSYPSGLPEECRDAGLLPRVRVLGLGHCSPTYFCYFPTPPTADSIWG